MKANFENIDGVFKEQLKNYSQSAPEGVWENIEVTLNGQKRVRKTFVFKVAASIAALAILGSSFFYFTQHNINTKPEFVIAENDLNTNDLESANLTNNEEELVVEDIQSEENNDNINVELVADLQEKKTTDNVVVKKENIKIETSDRTENLEKLDKKQILISEKKVNANIIDNRIEKTKPTFYNLPDIYNSYALNKAIESNETNNNNKWLIGGEFSPLYSYRHITNTSNTYSKDYYNASENASMTYTGGLNLQYKAFERLTIQAGVYYTTMGQVLDYMSVYSNKAYEMVADEYKDRFVNTYSIENSSGNINFSTSYVIVDDKLTRVNNLTDNKTSVDKSDPVFNDINGEIQQSFQYVEVPVIARYKIIDRNIDFNIVGGFGANFLVGNDVIVKYADNKEVIGKTQGVNSVNYNGTIGFGIDYPIMERINIRLEPSIKYYINEINPNSAIESHPYSIGIYTGINYSF